MKGRDLHEGLCDKHEHVEIKRRDRAGDKDPPPGAGETKAVIGGDRANEQNEREYADGAGGSKPNGGSGKPVRLVRIVVTKKTTIAVLKF